jgi:peptidoglycan/LPS O-acetylase OafA/YrhL
MDTPLPTLDERRPDLDWLRVVAILLLHLFHTGMMFNSWDWHLKSPVALTVLEPPMEFLHHVRMPLLMVISGVGTAFALRRRSVAAFGWDRTKRLLWPLVFGMFVVVPPQIFIERLHRGTVDGGYLDFYPSVLDFVPYPHGSFSWHHLWFIAYLFIYCVLALPLFVALDTPRGRELLARADAWLSRGWNVGLLVLPLWAGQYLLRRYPETHALIDDPRTLLYYGQLFVIGHLLGRCPGVWAHLVARRRALLGLTALLFAIMVPSFEFPHVLESLGRDALVWGVLLTAFAFARAHVTERRPWVVHAQELTYPFYILHQTVILLVGWALLPLKVGPWSLLGLVLTLSFLATWGLSEAIARVRWLRPCFGLKAPSVRATVPRTGDARSVHTAG